MEKLCDWLNKGYAQSVSKHKVNEAPTDIETSVRSIIQLRKQLNA